MDSRNQGLNERLERKKRIQRIKTGLIWLILTWMLALMLVSIVLIFKVNSLQRQIDIITKNTIRSQQVEQKENQSGGSGEVQKYDPTAQTGSQIGLTGTTAVLADLSGRAKGDGADTRKVYLTFDDGPSANTEKILAILDEYQVKATFFVTGREDEASLKLYKEITDRGHTIGMHSYSHKYSILYRSLWSFRRDFNRIQEKIKQVCGIKCRLYRFPGGSSNQVSDTPMTEFIRYLNEKNVTYFDWNVECGDASSKQFTTDMMVENVMNDVVKHRTSVVLMHDASDKAKTVEALPVILKKLRAMDAQILPIDDSATVIQHIPSDSVK